MLTTNSNSWPTLCRPKRTWMWADATFGYQFQLWREKTPHSMAIGSGSSISPTNSSVATIRATKIKEGKRSVLPRNRSYGRLEYRNIISLNLSCLWNIIHLSLCLLLMCPDRHKALDNFILTSLLFSLPWPLWWGAGKEQPCAFREDSTHCLLVPKPFANPSTLLPIPSCLIGFCSGVKFPLFHLW